MKLLLFSSMMLMAALVHAQQKDPKSTVESFFVAFHAKDTVAMKRHFAGGMVLQSISEGSKGVKFSNETSGDMLKSIGSIPATMKFEERILSYDVKIDGSMAHVWTPYEFYVNGKFSHSGVNSFHLYKENEVWKIAHLIDTRRRKQ